MGSQADEGSELEMTEVLVEGRTWTGGRRALSRLSSCRI
jgi:hypothetical protein